jgi:hypothetical protein
VRTLYGKKITLYWLTGAQTGKYLEFLGWKNKLDGTIRNEEKFDGKVEKFLVDIQQSAWENTPGIKGRTNGNNYPKEIRDLIAEKRKARRRW